MQKFQLRCSCVHCHMETTVQSLSPHIKKCTADPKNNCKHCKVPTNNESFCSHSCRAKYINCRREKKPKPPTRWEIGLNRFLKGKISERSALRKYLTKTVGYYCYNCELSDWDSKPITLIVDHKDGNAGNNFPSNLQLLCPNCNSQTPTFAGRNKGYGRKSRGLPLN